MTAARNPHDETDRRNWPLGTNAQKRLKGSLRAEYKAWIIEHDREEREANETAHELSPERLKERVDELTEELRLLKKYLWIAGVKLPQQ